MAETAAPVLTSALARVRARREPEAQQVQQAEQEAQQVQQAELEAQQVQQPEQEAQQVQQAEQQAQQAQQAEQLAQQVQQAACHLAELVEEWRGLVLAGILTLLAFLVQKYTY